MKLLNLVDCDGVELHDDMGAACIGIDVITIT